MSERDPRRVIAASTALLLGVTVMGGCASRGPKYTNCVSTHVTVEGASSIRDSIVHSLDAAMIADTGSGLPDGTAYTGASKTAEKIQDRLVEQYALGGVTIDTDQYALAETNPFKNALIRFCVGQREKVDGTLIPASPGSIQLGNLACILTYENYVGAIKVEGGREVISELCGGEQALPENLR